MYKSIFKAYLKKLDTIAEKNGLDTIKTVGDTYMCASALPNTDPDHDINAVKIAKEMVDLVNAELNSQDGLTHYEIGIGLHSRPVVVGIVGI